MGDGGGGVRGARKRGGGRLGLVRPRLRGCEPRTPLPEPPRAESSGDSPLNLKGSLANDPLGLEEKELKYLVTVLNLRKFVSRKLVPSSHCLLLRVHFFPRFKNLPFKKQNFAVLVASIRLNSKSE